MADAAIHTDRDAESEAAADTAGRNRVSETAQEYPRRRLRREQEEAPEGGCPSVPGVNLQLLPLFAGYSACLCTASPAEIRVQFL